MRFFFAELLGIQACPTANRSGKVAATEVTISFCHFFHQGLFIGQPLVNCCFRFLVPVMKGSSLSYPISIDFESVNCTIHFHPKKNTTNEEQFPRTICGVSVVADLLCGLFVGFLWAYCFIARVSFSVVLSFVWSTPQPLSRALVFLNMRRRVGAIFDQHAELAFNHTSCPNKNGRCKWVWLRN